MDLPPPKKNNPAPPAVCIPTEDAYRYGARAALFLRWLEACVAVEKARRLSSLPISYDVPTSVRVGLKEASAFFPGFSAEMARNSLNALAKAGEISVRVEQFGSGFPCEHVKLAHLVKEAERLGKYEMIMCCISGRFGQVCEINNPVKSAPNSTLVSYLLHPCAHAYLGAPLDFLNLEENKLEVFYNFSHFLEVEATPTKDEVFYNTFQDFNGEATPSEAKEKDLGDLEEKTKKKKRLTALSMSAFLAWLAEIGAKAPASLATISGMTTADLTRFVARNEKQFLRAAKAAYGVELEAAGLPASVKREVMDGWNKIAEHLDAPSIRSLTPRRCRWVRTRLAKFDVAPAYVYDCLRGSTFLREWDGFTFDWLWSREDNFVKVIERKYQRQLSRPQSPAQKSPLLTYQEMLSECQKLGGNHLIQQLFEAEDVGGKTMWRRRQAEA